MFYHAFAAIHEWAPPGENHILYSEAVLTKVIYGDKKVEYSATYNSGVEYLRLDFKPAEITLNGIKLSKHSDLSQMGYTVRDLSNGDYAVNIRRLQRGIVMVEGL